MSSPFTPTFGGKHHWLLVIDDNYGWSFFLKEKSNLAETMLGLVNNLETKFHLQLQYFHCNNAGEKQAFEKTCKQEWLGIALNIQPQAYLNKMGMLNASLLPYSTGHILCSTAERLPPFYKAVYGQEL